MKPSSHGKRVAFDGEKHTVIGGPFPTEIPRFYEMQDVAPNVTPEIIQSHERVRKTIEG